MEQAKEAGTLLRQRGFPFFDIAYTSRLQRARVTCEIAIAALESSSREIPIVAAWQLNERHYGKLQGRAKDDPSLIAEHGKDQIIQWRREFYATPPAMDESHPYYEPSPAPSTESLADCQLRVRKYWDTTIVPSLRAGNNALFVAHANSIRAITAYLDDVPPEHVVKIHIANCVPCVYRIDLETGTAIRTDHSRTEHSSKGLWLLSEANQKRLMEKLGGSSESFARSIFNAWDTNSDGELSKEEVRRGLYMWKKNDDTLSALLGKIWEELHKVDDESGPITLEKFQKYALLSVKKHNLPFFL